LTALLPAPFWRLLLIPQRRLVEEFVVDMISCPATAFEPSMVILTVPELT